MSDAFLRRDFDQALSGFHLDVKWDETNLPDEQISHCHQAILEHTARWQTRGRDVDERHSEIYMMKAGRIVRRRGFSDTKAALEAVGLRE